MPAPRSALVAFLLAALLPACAPTVQPLGGSADCADNSAPFIGNLTMNSTCAIGPELVDCFTTAGQEFLHLGIEEAVWDLTTEFQFADPGIAGATDPPNMVGGMVSWELSLGGQGSAWLYDPLDFDPGERSGYLAVERGAPQGLIALPAYLPETELSYQSPATLNVRVRDACDVESNNISCRYLMGTGEWIDCTPPAAPAE